MFHYVLSTSDTRYSVVQVAELHIKRIVGAVDLNSQSIANRFFQIFLGDKVAVKAKAGANGNEANIIEPANTRIRLKLFPYILRSRTASNTLPQSLQIVFDSLFGLRTMTNQKIKHYAVQFVHLMSLK